MEVKALQQILTQFRQMQENLQKQVESVHVEASAGGGMVTVKMNGQKQLTEIRIDPEIFAEKIRNCCRTWYAPPSMKPRAAWTKSSPAR